MNSFSLPACGLFALLLFGLVSAPGQSTVTPSAPSVLDSVPAVLKKAQADLYLQWLRGDASSISEMLSRIGAYPGSVQKQMFVPKNIDFKAINRVRDAARRTSTIKFCQLSQNSLSDLASPRANSAASHRETHWPQAMLNNLEVLNGLLGHAEAQFSKGNLSKQTGTSPFDLVTHDAERLMKFHGMLPRAETQTGQYQLAEAGGWFAFSRTTINTIPELASQRHGFSHPQNQSSAPPALMSQYLSFVLESANTYQFVEAEIQSFGEGIGGGDNRSWPRSRRKKATDAVVSGFTNSAVIKFLWSNNRALLSAPYRPAEQSDKPPGALIVEFQHLLLASVRVNAQGMLDLARYIDAAGEEAGIREIEIYSGANNCLLILSNLATATILDAEYKLNLSLLDVLPRNRSRSRAEAHGDDGGVPLALLRAFQVYTNQVGQQVWEFSKQLMETSRTTETLGDVSALTAEARRQNQQAQEIDRTLRAAKQKHAFDFIYCTANTLPKRANSVRGR